MTAIHFQETDAKEFAWHLLVNKTKYISNAIAHFCVNEDAIIHFNKKMRAAEVLISVIKKELTDAEYQSNYG